MIKLTLLEYQNIMCRLAEDYDSEPSVILIRSKMKEVLGFTPRHKREWNDGEVIQTVYLDFYNDAKETWFTLKYIS